MCVTSTAKRRRSQAKNSYRHLAVHGPFFPRPLYKKRQLSDVQSAIASERARAAREQARKAKK